MIDYPSTVCFKIDILQLYPLNNNILLKFISMKRNIGFVIIFAAVIYGLIQLHYCSLDKTVNVNNIVTIKHSPDLKDGQSIPFSQLLDIEYKKLLPESIDYETLRPNLILLSAEFNANNPLQLDYFPNIYINAEEDNSQTTMLTDFDDTKIEVLKRATERSLKQTPYEIIEWLPVAKISIDNAPGIKLSYKQKNTNNGRISNIVKTSAQKDNKEINIIMSVSDEDLFQWMKYYNGIVSSINFE